MYGKEYTGTGVYSVLSFRFGSVKSLCFGFGSVSVKLRFGRSLVVRDPLRDIRSNLISTDAY